MLGTFGKKILLSIHILLIAIWIGTLIASLVLVFLKKNTFNAIQFSGLDKSVFLLFDSIIMNISIAVTLSGLVFSVFTNWGFFRFYWIITKWVIIVFVAILIMFFASPAVNGMAALSDSFVEKVLNHPDYLHYQRHYILYTGVQIILLIFIVFISVIKPWGQRIPKKVINRQITIITGIVLGAVLIVSVTMQYVQLLHYRNLSITEVNLSQIDDGYYPGKVNYGFDYEVGVKIRNHSIQTVDILKNRKSFYARLAEGITYKVLREQKINLDGLTGATTTSRILLKAIEQALIIGRDDNNNRFK